MTALSRPGTSIIESLAAHAYITDLPGRATILPGAFATEPDGTRAGVHLGHQAARLSRTLKIFERFHGD